jgi:energy-converting hydrogenase Eha subunit B
MLFSWDNGTFNGGVFGNATIGENSTWKYGNFNGGRFQGRVWENGLFSAGEFIGSATFQHLVELLLEVLHLVINLKMDLIQIIMDFGEMV